MTSQQDLRPARARALRSRLSTWYAASRRDLPWRRTRDPYAIWISEAMLQQTRVETVLPYYECFLERLPDVAALAAASEDEVCALWSGLGYYRRARALRAAARVLVERHGGRFPRERSAALALPGVGPYTAGAVLSIAYDRPEPLVDGNVARVFARWFDLDAPLGSAGLRRELNRLAASLVAAPVGDEVPPGARGPGAWNQALMELGALVCTSRRPACEACPVAGLCRARERGMQEERPIPAPRPEPLSVALEVLVLVDGARRVLLRRRPPTGRMAGLWELPTRELAGRPAAPLLWPADWDVAVPTRRRSLDRVGHGITRHRITAEVLGATLSARSEPLRGDEGHELRRLALEELEGTALTGMTRKILGRTVVRAFVSGERAPGDERVRARGRARAAAPGR